MLWQIKEKKQENKKLNLNFIFKTLVHDYSHTKLKKRKKK